ncbi:MAG TPA: DUF2851 family protein [Candidatus Kryptonia bacterium]
MLSDLSEFQLKELLWNRKFDPNLKAVSGRRVEIVQTGELNSDTGPDFRNALVKLDGVAYRGDIELHRRSSDWISHNHQLDRNYNSVVLHVVVEADHDLECFTQARRRIETVELSNYLSADAERFLSGLEREDYLGTLKCMGRAQSVPSAAKMEFLNLLGERRFMHKANKFEERLKDIIDENRPVVFEAKQKYFKDFSELLIEHKSYDDKELREEAHWDQLLYEGIVEGLGYSKNTASFRKLSRNVTLSFLSEQANGDVTVAESILFGVAGLLPHQTTGFDEESVNYARRIEGLWLGLKKKYKREFLDKSEWLFFKLRPQNFPSVRIAGAAQMVTGRGKDFTAKSIFESIAHETASDPLRLWRDLLTVPAKDFWSRHFVFGEPAATKIRMLVGSNRAEEIIINVLLPLAYLRGKIFQLQDLQQRSLDIYSRHFPTADNNVTLLVKEALFGGDNVLGNVIAQQGALHLYRTLCSEKRCFRCKIGKTLFGKSA